MTDDDFTKAEREAERERWVSGQYHILPNKDAPSNVEMQEVIDAHAFARMLESVINWKYRSKLRERPETHNEPATGTDRQDPDH